METENTKGETNEQRNNEPEMWLPDFSCELDLSLFGTDL
jgi:hypothetical protein